MSQMNKSLFNQAKGWRPSGLIQSILLAIILYLFMDLGCIGGEKNAGVRKEQLESDYKVRES